MGLAELLYRSLGGALPLRLELYDGSTAGPDDAKATLRVNSRDGLARFLSRPGELGIVRAYVSGDVDIEGDLFTALEEAAGLELKINRKFYKLTPAEKTAAVAGGRGEAIEQRVEKYDRTEIRSLEELTSGDLVDRKSVV